MVSADLIALLSGRGAEEQMYIAGHCHRLSGLTFSHGFRERVRQCQEEIELLFVFIHPII